MSSQLSLISSAQRPQHTLLVTAQVECSEPIIANS